MNIKSQKSYLKLGATIKKWMFLLLATTLFSACKKEKSAEPATPAPGKITFSLQLADTKANILFNDSSASIYQNEYNWSIYIDSDSDSTTGNTEGFDVEVSMWYSKQSNNPMYGDLLSYTHKNTWIREKFMGTSAHILTASIDAASNCLLLTGNKDWQELVSVNAGDKMKVETYCLNGRDNSGVGKFPDDISDIQGDVSLPYIDIISLKIIQ